MGIYRYLKTNSTFATFGLSGLQFHCREGTNSMISRNEELKSVLMKKMTLNIEICLYYQNFDILQQSSVRRTETNQSNLHRVVKQEKKTLRSDICATNQISAYG